METARGLNYAMQVDIARNRLEIQFFGDLTDPKENENIPSETRDASERLTKGFTCLADFTKVGLLGLPDIAKQVQETLVQCGVGKVASVWSTEGFAKLVIQRSANQASGGYSEKRKVFSDLGEAEAWLDS